MNNFVRMVLSLVFLYIAPVLADPLAVSVVELPESKVLAVKTANHHPSAYAEAFGKLVGYYAQPSNGVKVIFPQQSITINGVNYSAIAIESAIMSPDGIEMFALPPCRFLSAAYTGNYNGIGAMIERLITQAISSGYKIVQSCGIRIHHLNSPDDTPIDNLKHVIYVPINKV